jgi:hypothetical protein
MMWKINWYIGGERCIGGFGDWKWRRVEQREEKVEIVGMMEVREGVKGV